MAFVAPYRRQKQEAADELEKNPLTTLRACLAGDPVTFAELVSPWGRLGRG